MKRTFDFILALFGLVFSFPLCLLFTVLIWCESGSPVFYLQERVGKDGLTFKSIKFRSMRQQACEKNYFTQASEHDKRVTKVGEFLRRTALDELPQLINILKGEMSFVGPRALVACEKEVCATFINSIFEIPGFTERSKVKPGLTGAAQAFAPRDISRQQKFEYDIWYINNRSFFLDIYLILLSFLITLKSKWEVRKNRFNYLGKKLKLKIESQICQPKA